MSKRFTLKLDGEIIAAFNDGNRMRSAIDMAFREVKAIGYDGDIYDDFLIGFVLAGEYTIRNIHAGWNTLTLEVSE